MAVLAKAAHKPFYVTVESYKFVRDFPLGQDHVDTAIGSTVNLEEAAPDQPASDKTPADVVRVRALPRAPPPVSTHMHPLNVADDPRGSRITCSRCCLRSTTRRRRTSPC